MSARGRRGLGALAVVLGIAGWVAIRALPAPEVAGVRVALLSLRWSAVALAVGGLVLAARGWRRGIQSAVGLGLAWLGVDAAFSWSGGTAGTVATALPVAALAAALLHAGRHRGDGPAQAPFLLGYAGFLLAGSMFAYISISRTDLGEVRWAAWPMVCGMLGLAAVLALAAGPLPASRSRRHATAAFAVVVLVPPTVTGVTTDGMADVGLGAGLRDLLIVLFLFGCPVAVALLVALTGSLPHGRRGRALAVLVPAGFPIITTILFGLSVVDETQLAPASPGYPWLVATTVSIGAALVGVVAVVGAGLVRAAGSPATPREAGVPIGADWRAVVGAAIALAGVATWLVMVLRVYPAIAAVLEYWHEHGGYLPYGLDATNNFEGIGWDVRLSAILLAAGGLRLVARTRVRRRVVLGCVAGWFCCDVLLMNGRVPGTATRPVVIIVAFAVVAGVLVLLAVPVPRDAAEAGRRSRWTLVYSGVLGATGLLLLQYVDPWMHTSLESWMMPAIGGLTVLLVVAAVLTALSAAPRPGGLVAVGGVWFALVAVCAAGALDFVRVAGLLRTDGPRTLVCGLVLGGLVLGCAVLGGFVPAGTTPRTWTAAVGASVFGGPIAAAGAALTGFILTYFGGTLLNAAVKVDTPFVTDDGAMPVTLAGMLAGATIAVIALLPQALSTPDDPVDAAAPPPVADPAPKRAPVAVPGVPEILEWPVSG